MMDRPIIFNRDMVRAILDGMKTQTRRIVKQQLSQLGDGAFYSFDHKGINYRVNALHTTTGAWKSLLQFCPFGQPGDRIWVRETFGIGYNDGAGGYSAIPWTGSDERRDGKVFYRADFSDSPDSPQRPWRPSIHMPRWASRITLEITGLRVERLNDISERDAWAEGCEGFDDDVTGGKSGYGEYAELWESINGLGSWNANPWVWVIEFKLAGNPA